MAAAPRAEVADVGAGWHVSLAWLAARLAPGTPATTLADFEALAASSRAAFA